MRAVRCKITGEYGTVTTFYKAPDGKYYKNKEIYEHAKAEKEYRDKIINIINSKILITTKSNCTSFIAKMINESGLDNQTIYNQLNDRLDYIKKITDYSNESDLSKILLAFSVITKNTTEITYAGCYEIRNIKTNEVYIGESINLFGRIAKHISDLYENNHHCKKLQNAFNEDKSIENFIIKPLFVIPIASIDKNNSKEDTLYLESAFYLIAKEKNESLYNTIDPYAALKSNNVSLNNYEIDCNKVLKKIIEDKYNVMPKELQIKIKEDLKDIITFDNKNEICEQTNTKDNPKNNQNDKSTTYITKVIVEDESKLYRITNLLKELVDEHILPHDYNYSKIRNILSKNNLITIDKNGHTVATEYSLNNNLYIIDKEKHMNDEIIYNYYISESGKDAIKNIFANYKNTDDLRTPPSIK